MPASAGGLFGSVMWVEFVGGFDGIDVHDTAVSSVASKNTEAIVRGQQADRCVPIRNPRTLSLTER